MNNVTAYYRSSAIQGLFEVILLLLVLLLVSAPVGAAEPDKTPEDIQKKAVIIKYPTAKLFKQATGDTGDEASFMQLYFIMKPEMNGRVPVSRSPNKTGEPDGWLAKESFMEWNTVQMIQLEPQSGRRLAKVFNTQQCAYSFAREGQTPSGCEELGEEPSVWEDKRFENQKLLIPVFAKENEVFQGGFIRVFETTGKPVTVVPPESAASIKHEMLGYDMVFVVDSTMGMGEYLTPIAEVIQEFLVENFGKVNAPLRIGVLFYRDRLIARDSPCSIGYLTKWSQPLTEQISLVINALKTEKEADCGSEEREEAVLDGLYQAISSADWRDDSFRSIVLIGDAPAHRIDKIEKNPMKLDDSTIIRQAEEKGIRFINIKVGEREDDITTFKNLAFTRNF